MLSSVRGFREDSWVARLCSGTLLGVPLYENSAHDSGENLSCTLLKLYKLDKFGLNKLRQRRKNATLFFSTRFCIIGTGLGSFIHPKMSETGVWNNQTCVWNNLFDT